MSKDKGQSKGFPTSDLLVYWADSLGLGGLSCALQRCRVLGSISGL